MRRFIFSHKNSLTPKNHCINGVKILASIVCGLWGLTLMAGSTPEQLNSDFFGISKISPTILNKLNKTDQPFPILIQLRDQADLSKASQMKSLDQRRTFVFESLRSTANETQGPLVDFLSSKGLSYQAFYIANMIAVDDVSLDVIKEIAAREDVVRVFGNFEFKAAIPKGDSFDKESFNVLGVGANIARVKADKVWSEFNNRGEGIVVAGQDTGVDWTHPALKRQYRGYIDDQTADHAYSWHDSIKKAVDKRSRNRCGYNLKAPCDDNDHGTHTIGTVVGDDGKGNQVGMAPGAKWIACRNMDAGVGRPSTYIECFEFFLAPYPQGGDPRKDGMPSKAPHVMNNSWGCDATETCEGGEFLPVLKSLAAAGVMVVASAGNDGSSCSTIKSGPAHHSKETLSVGAINHTNDSIASFSSRGPSTFDSEQGPDICAPGVSIRSSVPGGGFASSMWSGTSMAGPHVVGQIALMWAVNRNLIGNIDKTTEIVRKTALPKTTTQTCGSITGDKIPNNTFGYGIIDAYKAVKGE